MARAKQQKLQRSHFAKRKKSTSNNADAFLDELDDDIDKFHKESDKIPLDVDDDNELSADEMEEPVFNLKENSSEDDDEDMGTEDDDEMDEEKLSGLAAKMARQVKLLRRKTNLVDDEDEEEEEEDEKKDRKAQWGKRKKTYYSADNVDYELQSSDEEAPAEEEAEALRLQRLKAESLRPEDFELNYEEDDLVDENDRTLQEVVERQESRSENVTIPQGRRIGIMNENSSVLIEEVKKDVSALSKEEQMNVVVSDAPELLGLLTELRETLDELQKKVDPLIGKLKLNNTANNEGTLFLQTKRMLLVSYLQAIVFYLLMKAEGRSVRDHPVISRLVETRTLLQKLQPIEKKLENQIFKLMALDMKSLPSKGNPNISKVANQKASENGVLLEQQQQLSTKKDETMKHCEIQFPNGKMKKKLEHVVPLPIADAQIQSLRKAVSQSLSHNHIDEDEVLPTSKSLHTIIGSKVPTKRKYVTSGDMNLPVKVDLGDRRAKYDTHRIPKHVDSDDANEQDGVQSEDEFYQEAKRIKATKQLAKQKAHPEIPVPERLMETEVGKRHITYQMEKNKGLTPHRKKLTKNPRKKYKLKHQKALIRRKGQVREIKLPSGPYGGESTGIRTAISRSVRLQS